MNGKQLEISFDQPIPLRRVARHPRRMARAQWWFAQMRQVVDQTLTYLRNHQDKMHYEAYRRQGLPITSSHIESVVKQINQRVKGTEKFWSEDGSEAVLQLRADYLTDGQPLEAFWQGRQAAATGQRRYRHVG